MGATVKLEQVDKDRWRVSIIREGRPSAVLEADHERTLEIAWRAASLIPFWDSSIPAGSQSAARNEESPAIVFPRPGSNVPSSIPQRSITEVAHRYAIVDPTAPRSPNSQSEFEGSVMGSFASRELAEAFAEDEIRYGNPQVIVIDRKTRRRIYP
jgi:hypothetical protein